MTTVFVPKERTPGETRVALTPDTARRLVKRGFEVLIEGAAGEGAHLLDSSYESAGARVVDSAGLAKVWSCADLILKVDAPSSKEAQALRSNAVLIAMMAPHRSGDAIQVLRDRGITTFAMELVPRISRAQSMDALSSQASIGGYKAVIIAASHLDKYFPLMMTAAGTVQPAKVVVMGAGVAGLQAIATAKRLGARVEVSDIRPAVKEQVESLGGKFIDLPMQESGEGKGGYAKEVSAEFLEQQQAVVRERVVAADAVITTALVPGRPAPKLITTDMVEEMREGAVIVDMAVEQGGNCELTELGEVVRHGVRIVGHPNLPATMPADASHLYARNVAALVEHISDQSAIRLQLDDEIVRGALLTHSGEVTHGPTAKSLLAA